MAEGNTIGGRLRRYAKVSTAMGGIAARAAGEKYLGMKGDPARMAVDLREALGGLKGPLMKVAQILSTIPDVLPEEYTSELTQLQADAPRMGWPFVKRRMTSELGAGWPSKFQSFEKEAAAAASLGQVHRAVHHDGRQLACKLQYPDMDSTVEADLKQLKVIIGIYRRYDKAVDPSEVQAELAERLREELDYGREAKNMALYSHMLRNQAGVHIPESIPELSSKRLLTMTWMEGQRVQNFVDRDPEQRQTLAMNMFRAWYVPFYEYGVIHGDPHLGNYTVRPDDLSVNLLDFGTIRVFKPSFVKGVIDLYFALANDDPERAIHAYETWGFQNLSKELIAVLNQWALFVYGPLLEDRPRTIQEELPTGANHGKMIAEQVHADLRAMGGVTPPREFVLMDRAAIGLGSVFWRLKAEINWYQLFHELIGDFDVDKLATRQAEALKVAGFEEGPGDASSPGSSGS
jgi:predicted unusual protein kinase regulating ubiquinone biosynthesis (AarF/ABC1/UbiB family)